MAKSKSGSDPNQKIKLLAVCVVLFLAISWIAYQFLYTGKPTPVTGAKAEEIKQQTEQVVEELKAEQIKENHGKKPKPASGS